MTIKSSLNSVQARSSLVQVATGPKTIQKLLGVAQLKQHVIPKLNFHQCKKNFVYFSIKFNQWISQSMSQSCSPKWNNISLPVISRCSAKTSGQSKGERLYSWPTWI